MHPAILFALAPALSTAAAQAQMPPAPHPRLPDAYDTTVVAHCGQRDVSITLRSSPDGVSALDYRAGGQPNERVRDRVTAGLSGSARVSSLQISCAVEPGDPDYVWVSTFVGWSATTPPVMVDTRFFIAGDHVSVVR